MQINILKSGELVRDTGILYFYQILRELDEDKQIQPKLHRNHLSFEIPKEFDMKEALFTQIVDKKLYYAFLRDIKVDKLIDDDLLKKLVNVPRERLSTFLKETQISPDKIKKIIEKSQKIYFPYVRNSIKFGANSGKVVNFHQNLKEMLQLFLDSLVDQRDRLDQYGKGRCCSVCHENTAPFYDITCKYEIESINNIKLSERKIRKDSKYLYTFKGRENNTFSNYGRVNQASSICFECEFFSLLFLLYVKMELPQYLVITDNLKIMDLVQRKIQMKKDVHIEQAFYYHVASLGRSSKVQIYEIVRDPKEGILLQAEEIIEYDRLKTQLTLMDIVDKFGFPDLLKSKDRDKLIKHLKQYILNGNYDFAFQRLLANILSNDERRLAHNYKLLGNFLIETSNRSMKGARKVKMMDEMKKRGKMYWYFGNGFSQLENKKSLGFRLTQLLRSDNRIKMLEDLLHLYFTTTKKGRTEEFSNFPTRLTEDVLYSSNKEYHYYVGQIIQGLLAVKKEEK